MTVNYTWYGQNNYTFTGEWHNLRYRTIIGEEEVSIDLMTLVVYDQTPENGLNGFVGMAMSQYNPDYNFMYQLTQKTNFTGLSSQ